MPSNKRGPQCHLPENQLFCLNGGKCHDLRLGGFFCECRKPFYGLQCHLLAPQPLITKQENLVSVLVISFLVFFVIALLVFLVLTIKKIKKARATSGTYSPATNEKNDRGVVDIFSPPTSLPSKTYPLPQPSEVLI